MKNDKVSFKTAKELAKIFTLSRRAVLKEYGLIKGGLLIAFNLYHTFLGKFN